MYIYFLYISVSEHECMCACMYIWVFIYTYVCLYDVGTYSHILTNLYAYLFTNNTNKLNSISTNNSIIKISQGNDELTCFTFVRNQNTINSSSNSNGNNTGNNNGNDNDENSEHSITINTIPDITNTNSINPSRIFCGSVQGSVYIYQQLVDASTYQGSEGLRYEQLLPRGKLLRVITDVHNSNITDINYFSTNDNSSNNLNVYKQMNNSNISNNNNNSAKMEESIVTCGSDGMIHYWTVDQGDSAPMTHISTSPFNDITSDESFLKRSLSISNEGAGRVICNTSNSIKLISTNEINTENGNDNSNNNNKNNNKYSNNDGSNEGYKHTSTSLLNYHNKKIIKIASMGRRFATISADNLVCIWDSHSHIQTACIDTVANPTSITFTPDGQYLAVGTLSGDLVILADEDMSDNWELWFKKSIGSQINIKKHSASSSGVNRKSELTQLKYSPNGMILAVGCRDNIIYFLSPGNSYKRIGVSRGHLCGIKEFDFSLDGQILQSTDVGGKDLLFWDVSTGKQINAKSVKDAVWYTWSW